MNYATGAGRETAQRDADSLRSNHNSENVADALEQQVQQWRSFASEDFPFVSSVIDDFLQLDETQQFVSGLDLMLRGIEMQVADQTGASQQD